MSLGRSLDMSLDRGKEIRFKQKNKYLMEQLAKKSHFNYEEIEHLCIIYYKLQILGEGKNHSIRRSQLKDVLHNGLNMTNHKLTNCILSTVDKGLSPYVSMENWIYMMSLYLRGTLEEKIKYCFAVYKKKGLGDKITRNVMINLLEGTLKKDNNESDEEAVKDIVEMIMKKMDIDRDGAISFEDYQESVRAFPILLETFGRILPDRVAMYAFESTFMKNVKKM